MDTGNALGHGSGSRQKAQQVQRNVGRPAVEPWEAGGKTRPSDGQVHVLKAPSGRLNGVFAGRLWGSRAGPLQDGEFRGRTLDMGDGVFKP